MKTEDYDVLPDALEVVSVSKQFGHFCALDEISVKVKRSEFICLLGPSGCGKTTLLRIIAGLEKPSSGQVFQNGKDITESSPANRNFGIVFQSYALFPNLKVIDNVSYGLVNLKWTKDRIKARVNDLLNIVGLAGEGHKYPNQLSGGQQQRIALARALANSPDLLLLDEPLSALDARVRARLQDELRDLQTKLGITTIMVTHDQEEAISLADRIYVLESGKIAQEGSPKHIYTRPESRFIADFVGKMNIAEAVVASQGIADLGGLKIGFNGTIPKGASVSICIRPEDIRIMRNDQSDKDAFRMVVQRVRYMGPFNWVRVVDQEQRKTCFDIMMSAADASWTPLNIGDEVKVMLPVDRIRVFTNEA